MKNTNDKQTRKNYEDQYIARCNGLIQKMARKTTDNNIVYAHKVTKNDGPFYCPSCLSEAIVRKCTEKDDHFAHHARQSPILKIKDRALHTQCQNEILKFLQSAFPEGKWEKERPILENPQKGYKKIIPDISGRLGNTPVGIEIQLSSYTIDKIYDKLIEYNKRGLYALYIIPLHKELGDEPFRPRLFEKYLHALYYGRIYYWIPNNHDYIFPVHLQKCTRWIPETSWYDENGEEQCAGGYYKQYKTIYKPIYGDAVTISEDFKTESRHKYSHNNINYEIPACKILIDKQRKWWENASEDSSNNYNIVDNSNDYINYDDYDDYDEYDE